MLGARITGTFVAVLELFPVAICRKLVLAAFRVLVTVSAPFLLFLTCFLQARRLLEPKLSLL